MNLKELVNSGNSVLGAELQTLMNDGSDPETAERLTERYMDKGVDRVKRDVYYRVNSVVTKKSENGEPEVYLERDCLKSPREIPDWQQTFDLVGESGDAPKGAETGKTPVSFDGGFILRWAYFQNANSSHPFFIDGCDIVSRYGEGDNAIRKGNYYFLSRNEHGVAIRRDLSRSPRKGGKEEKNNGAESEAVPAATGG